MISERIQLGGPHHKKCHCGCGIEFFGRKNQKYYCISHKAKFNNLKQAKLISNFKPIFDQMIINYKALKKHLPKSNEKEWIYIGNLVKDGFNPDAAFENCFDSPSGNYYQYIIDVAFILSEDKTFIQIAPTKFDKND